MYLSLCQKDDLKAKKTLPPDGEVLVLILLDLESLMRKDIFLVQDADISNLSFFTWFQNTPVLSMNLITFSSGSSTLRSTPAVLAILSTRLFITVFSCHFYHLSTMNFIKYNSFLYFIRNQLSIS